MYQEGAEPKFQTLNVAHFHDDLLLHFHFDNSRFNTPTEIVGGTREITNLLA